MRLRVAKPEHRELLALLKVPVRRGYFSLSTLLDAIDNAEVKGRISPEEAQLTRAWVNQNFVAFQTDELPWAKSTGVDRNFAASRDVKTKPEFQQAAEAARSLAYESPPTLYKTQVYRREAHLQLPGGRVPLRYKPKAKGAHAPVFRMGAASKKRLAEEDAPFDARTQSEKSRSPNRRRYDAETIKAEIVKAIQAYMAAHPSALGGFRVPRTVEALTKFGFPKKEAKVLVQRARGKTYVDEGKAAAYTPTTTDLVESALGISRLNQDDSGGLYFEVESVYKTAYNADLYAHACKRVAEAPKKWQKSAAEGERGGKVSTLRSRLFLKSIQVGARSFRDTWKTEGRYTWFSGLPGGEDVLSIRPTKWTWSLRVGYPGEAEGFIQVDVPITELRQREHSDFLHEDSRPDYRSLNVSLGRLPSLLVRITRRSGARIKENPMSDWDDGSDWWESDQYEQQIGQFGARGYGPTNRRNPSSLENRGRPVRAAGGDKKKFIALLKRRGYSAAQAEAAWSIHKMGGKAKSHKSAWAKIHGARKSTWKASSKKKAPKKKAVSKKSASRKSSKVPAAFKKMQKLGPKAMALAKREGISLKAAWARIKRSA